MYSRDDYADGHEESWLLVFARTGRRRVPACTACGPILKNDIMGRMWDLTRFHSTAWSLVVNQLVFVCLAYSLLQIHLLGHGHQELNRRTRPTSRRLLPDGDRVIIYRQQCFGFFTLLEHIRFDAEPGGKARRRALAEARNCAGARSRDGPTPAPRSPRPPGDAAPYV